MRWGILFVLMVSLGFVGCKNAGTEAESGRSVQLPRSIRGLALGQKLTEVEKVARERNLPENYAYKTSSFYKDDSRMYYLKGIDPDFLSISVTLEGGRVVKLGATYNSEMGKYEQIIDKAKTTFGVPKVNKQWKTSGQWPWHWLTIWADTSTVISISHVAESKNRAESPDLTIEDRAAYEEHLSRVAARQKSQEDARGKNMFGGD